MSGVEVIVRYSSIAILKKNINLKIFFIFMITNLKIGTGCLNFQIVDYSGISLLGLQDFTGHGTALVGMLNAHLRPKPFQFAKPDCFRRFFSDLTPLVLLEKYTYLQKELV